MDQSTDEQLSQWRHELRNHLTPILALAQVLEQQLDEASQPKQKQMAQTIVRRAQELNAAIGKIRL